MTVVTTYILILLISLEVIIFMNTFSFEGWLILKNQKIRIAKPTLKHDPFNLRIAIRNLQIVPSCWKKYSEQWNPTFLVAYLVPTTTAYLSGSSYESQEIASSAWIRIEGNSKANGRGPCFVPSISLCFVHSFHNSILKRLLFLGERN